MPLYALARSKRVADVARTKVAVTGGVARWRGRCGSNDGAGRRGSNDDG